MERIETRRLERSALFPTPKSANYRSFRVETYDDQLESCDKAITNICRQALVKILVKVSKVMQWQSR